MRTILLAGAAILSMAAGPAMAERAPDGQQQLAAQIDTRGGSLARNGLPDGQTNRHRTQYAAGGGAHPQAETNRRSIQA